MHNSSTRLPQVYGPKSFICMAKKLLISRAATTDWSGARDPSHDTTEERIGWRVTPAAYLGGDSRGRGCARSRLFRLRMVKCWFGG